MNTEQKIMSSLGSTPQGFVAIARKIGWPRHKNKELTIVINNMVQKSKIIKNKDGFYFVPEIIKKIRGIIKVHPNGFAFLESESLVGEETVFINSANTNFAMNDDEVLVSVFQDDFKPSAYRGIVEQVLTRNKTRFVGTIKKLGEQWGIEPLDPKISFRFRFQDPSKIRENLQVVARIVKFGKNPVVKIEKVLGLSSDNFVDVLSWIEEFNVPHTLGKPVLEEAKLIPDSVNSAEVAHRKDFRKNLVVTIDGEDTKDFDDAIEVEKCQNGNFLLRVHIADVSYYVQENSQVDLEASRRGTSIYLPNKVIPMLPEKLSNGICSLNPNVDRMTVTCEAEITPHGKNVNTKIYESVINSKKRLTYEQVNDFYNKKHQFGDLNLEKMLTSALRLSGIIRKSKTEQGYIDFEIPETKLVLDDRGKTQDIQTKERSYAEIMIEDFMVRANEIVAKHVFKKKLPFIYRTHSDPSPEKLQNLQNFINVLNNLKVKVPLQVTPSGFSEIISKVKKIRFDDLIKLTLLQTMEKAVYSEQNTGHFGLASDCYTHFTSPIRRYPDLMVHRMLRTYFFGNQPNPQHRFSDLVPQVAKNCSRTEKKAMDLERKILDVKKAEFFENKVGLSYDGTVVSVNKFGFFVDFYKSVSGLVRVENIIDGKYYLAEDKLSLKSDKQKFTIGQKVQVTVAVVFRSEGKIELVLTNQYHKWKGFRKSKRLENGRFQKKKVN